MDAVVLSRNALAATRTGLGAANKRADAHFFEFARYQNRVFLGNVGHRELNFAGQSRHHKGAADVRLNRIATVASVDSRFDFREVMPKMLFGVHPTSLAQM